MPKLHFEPLLFCAAWAALAIAGFAYGGRWAGALLSMGLLPPIMAASAYLITQREDFALERQVRWGILVLAGLAFGLWLRS